MTKYYFIISCFLYVLYGHSSIGSSPVLMTDGPEYRRENVLVDSMILSDIRLTTYEKELLFTEIMYDPPFSCPEYLEITNMDYNVTSWDNLWLQKSSGHPVKLDLPPAWPVGESRIITSDRAQFIKCYHEVNADLVYESDLFALTNTGTTITLISKDPVERVIDRVSYSPSDQNKLFSNVKGVALERNLNEPENSRWRSGFVQFGYRSPGFLPDWEWNTNINILFSSSVIYSVSGRHPSELEIQLESERVDGNITIEIFDLNGTKVQTLADGVPTQGGEIFIWKGRTKSGELLPEGLYLFWIYYFDIEGRKRIFRKTCVLSNN